MERCGSENRFKGLRKAAGAAILTMSIAACNNTGEVKPSLTTLPTEAPTPSLIVSPTPEVTPTPVITPTPEVTPTPTTEAPTATPEVNVALTQVETLKTALTDNNFDKTSYKEVKNLSDEIWKNYKTEILDMETTWGDGSKYTETYFRNSIKLLTGKIDNPHNPGNKQIETYRDDKADNYANSYFEISNIIEQAGLTKNFELQKKANELLNMSVDLGALDLYPKTPEKGIKLIIKHLEGLLPPDQNLN